MGEKVPLVLSVTGDLDTSAPVTNRALGALTRARDVHPRKWGPKEGCQSFTRLWETTGPGTASLYDGIDLTTGASTYGTGISFEDQFRDLGVKWTLDLWFRLTSTAFAAGKDKIGLYKFVVNASGVIEVSVTGPSHATPGHMQAYIITNPSAGVTDAPVTSLFDTAIPVGSTQTDKVHFRLVRSGVALTGYLNGIPDQETPSTLVATSGILAAPGTAAIVALGQVYAATDPTVTFKGQIFGAVLRDGAFSPRPVEARMPCNPHARNVHHYYLGRNYALGGNDHYFDASRYGAHARISGAGYTVTAANDNTAPAPSTVQGMASWTTRGNRTATSVVAGGVLSTKVMT